MTNHKDNQPLVSIITPMYNASRYIIATIRSVVSQTYQNWEWIIVDDCSKDGSLDATYKLATDPRIRIYSLRKNSGVPVARNKGLRHAKGDYVTFLDADDTLDPTYLEKQVAFIKDHGPIITAGYRRKTRENITDFMPPEEVTYHMMLKGNPLSCLTTMYDFKMFPDERFDEDLVRHEDYLFWLRIAQKAGKCYSNQEILATYTLHSGSKNIAKRRLVIPLYTLFRAKLHFSRKHSLTCVLAIILYSRKKYRKVKF